ncbi:MAG: hypothetical protein K2K93_01450 [Muribaculaceae bacterium]|nr:hypothetical protein [Muribaculaceae bacterium]
MAENQQQSGSGYVVLNHIGTGKKRPKVPSMLFVTCEYGDGYVSFTFPENVSTLTFRIYNDGEEISGMVTSDNTTAKIPSLHGVYNIECIDDGYRIYFGVLHFQ